MPSRRWRIFLNVTLSLARLQRRYTFKHFPYPLVFDVVDDIVRVLVLRHQKRHPDYWLKRKW